jgi:hypothetical protein
VKYIHVKKKEEKKIPFEEIYDQKFTANKNFFFSLENHFFFLTYIQPPMAHLKIIFWRKKIDRVAQLLASKGSKKHLLGHIFSFECCNFAKKKIGVSLAYIEFLLLLVHSGQVAGNVRFFACGSQRS